MADLGITVSRGVLRQLAAGQRSQLWLPVRVPDGHELEQVQCGEVSPGPALVVVRANDSDVLKRGRCPFGRVGDWLYVREQWATASDGRTRYRRDGGTLPAGQQWCSRGRCPSNMPGCGSCSTGCGSCACMTQAISTCDRRVSAVQHMTRRARSAWATVASCTARRLPSSGIVGMAAPRAHGRVTRRAGRCHSLGTRAWSERVGSRSTLSPIG